MSLQIQEQNNTIIVPLEIKLEKLNELKELVAELKQIDISGIPQSQGRKSKKGATTDAEMGEVIKKYLGIQDAKSGARTATQLFSNPKGFLIGLMTNPYVAAAFIAAGLGSAILDFLMLQGNILDRNFKRIIAKEILAGVRRTERKQTQTGLGRQVIITSQSGSNQPEYSFNSYEARRTGEIDAMTAFQIRRGYKF